MKFFIIDINSYRFLLSKPPSLTEGESDEEEIHSPGFEINMSPVATSQHATDERFILKLAYDINNLS